jgi:hypothetical protein
LTYVYPTVPSASAEYVDVFRIVSKVIRLDLDREPQLSKDIRYLLSTTRAVNEEDQLRQR